MVLLNEYPVGKVVEPAVKLGVLQIVIGPDSVGVPII